MKSYSYTDEEIEKIIDGSLKYFDFPPKQGIALEGLRKWYEKRKQIKGSQDEKL